MDWFIVLAPGLLLFAVIGGLVLRSRQRQQELEAGIEAKGWRMVRQSRGFDVEGGDLVPWQMRVRRSSGSSSSSSSSTTLWEIPAPPSDAVVLFGPKLPMALPSLGGSLVQFALRAILGDEAADLADAREVQVGSPAFRESFSVISSDPQLAEQLLTAEVEEALQACPLSKVAVLRWRDRLQVRLTYALWTLDEITQLEALGQVLATVDREVEGA